MNKSHQKKGYVDQVSRLQKKDYLKLIQNALEEDHFEDDITSNAIFKKNDTARAVLLCKQEGILCGMDIFEDVFRVVDRGLKISSHKHDRDAVARGDIVSEIHGRTTSILKAERVALNFISMLSGIATKSRKVSEILAPFGIIPLDTRKTLPGFRRLSKYAVFVGGAINHRLCLSDMGLIKDNHIAAAGGVANSIRMFKQKYPDKKCEVEVETLDQLQEALPQKPDMVLLDNMPPALLKRCVRIVREFNKINHTGITCEASGGFTIDNLRNLKSTGVDYVSMGSLTNHIDPVDFSLEVIRKV